MTGNDYKHGLGVGRGLDKTMALRRLRALDNPKEDKLMKLILLADKEEEMLK